MTLSNREIRKRRRAAIRRGDYPPSHGEMPLSWAWRRLRAYEKATSWFETPDERFAGLKGTPPAPINRRYET